MKEGIYMKQKNRAANVHSSRPVMILLTLSGGTQGTPVAPIFLRDHALLPMPRRENIVFNGMPPDLRGSTKDSIHYFLSPVAFLHWGYLWSV